ncbi:uncharacterized protein LOC62_04G005607 [Vanrija pseudolonga]|uniref:Uncharacterized protein n=2 Tax=Vanrija pseudolonga TaxID=143232 RepID=A0AAF0Y8P8_9TREE|nr:hypothetical protein LOC62_04G005607 [Vanrija pseudolonga]
MAFDASNPPLRSAPTSSSLVAPPLLTDRSAPGSNSSHSLSTTLVVTPVSTPPSKYSYPRYPGIASTSPPSAFANKRNSSSSLPIASIFESEEQRFDLLKTLDNPRADPKAELDWEVIDYADAPYPPEVKRSRSARLRINKMSMAEPPRPPPKKSGGSFLRRLTQSNHHGQDKRAPAPEAKRASPPQLPPVTGPDSRPISLNLNSIVPEVTAGNPQARPLPNGIDAPNGVRDAHARALSPTGPSPPAKQFGGVSSPSGYPSRPPPNSSLPPGAAAPEHGAISPSQQRPAENRSSFRVQGRPDRTASIAAWTPAAE